MLAHSSQQRERKEHSALRRRRAAAGRGNARPCVCRGARGGGSQQLAERPLRRGHAALGRHARKALQSLAGIQATLHAIWPGGARRPGWSAGRGFEPAPLKGLAQHDVPVLLRQALLAASLHCCTGSKGRRAAWELGRGRCLVRLAVAVVAVGAVRRASCGAANRRVRSGTWRRIRCHFCKPGRWSRLLAARPAPRRQRQQRAPDKRRLAVSTQCSLGSGCHIGNGAPPNAASAAERSAATPVPGSSVRSTSSKRPAIAPASMAVSSRSAAAHASVRSSSASSVRMLASSTGATLSTSATSLLLLLASGVHLAGPGASVSRCCKRLQG